MTLHARSFFRCLIWNDTGYSARRHLCACILKSARYKHCIFYTLVWLAPGEEAELERASETSPVWCGHKDVLHLNKHNPWETGAAVVNGVANPSPAPALIALNIFNALIWKK